MSIFEAIMLVCFGAAWPASIYKSFITKTAKGKSLAFLFIVLAGYVSGILHKIFYNLDWILVLYIINSIMVFVDLILTFRNHTLDAQAEN
jgi:hypothetical protein